MKNKIFTIVLMGAFALFSTSIFAQSGESQTGAVPKSGNEVVKKDKIEKDDKGRTIIKSNKKEIKKDVDKKVKDIKDDGESTLTSGNNTVVKGAPKVDEGNLKATRENVEDEIKLIENNGNNTTEEVREARLKKEEGKQKLGLAVKNGNAKVLKAKERIQLAKEKLSLEKKNMTKEAYNEKASKIEKVEIYIKKLEDKLSSAGKVKE